MNLTPPRIEEGYEAKPTPREDTFGATIEKMSSDAFADAWKKATEAGRINVSADDPRIVTAFKQTNKYLADMASAGMSLAEGVGGAVAGAIGEVFGGTPEGEVRLARDIYSMTEAFAGSGIARGANLMDDLVESGAATASKVAARANQPGPMPEVLGSNLGNLAAPKAPYKPSGFEGTSDFGKVRNPAFLEESWRERPYAQYNSDLNLLASFYSPLKSTIEQMPIAKEGSTGQTILAYLKKRAPNVSSSELEYSGLKLDPNQRYTREDLSRLLKYSTDDVYASISEVRPKKSNLKSSDLNLSKAMRFSEVQPQKVVDKQQAYFEITLDSDTLPKPLVPGATTHHGERTLAHTRGSINTGPDGNYILVWELQSDPLQNIGKKYNPLENTGYGGPDTFRGLWVEEKLRDLVVFDTQAAPNKKLFEDVIKKSFESDLSREELKKFYGEKYNIQVSGKTLGDIHKDAIRKTTVSIDEPFEDFLDEFFVELDRSATDYRKAEATLEKSEIPFTTNTQYVKNLLTSLIARAKKDGISKIVIPSIQEIARQRADSFEGGIDGAIKALKPTYVNAVNKAINILNSEGKGKIDVGTRYLQYPDLTQKNSLRNSVATELDISGFDFDAEKQRVRFSKGGMVDTPQKSILDFSPEDFEAALKELGLEKEQEEYVRSEYSKRNTLAGQMKSAFQEATNTPEGRVRSEVLPMTKPEGMSGWEAIRSGEAELAVPGFLTGAVEGAGQALTTLEKVTQGIGVTEGELQQAAEIVASLGMANIPRAIARGYDPTITPIFGGPNAKKFPAVRAEAAKLSKKSPDEIWRETGIEFITDEFGTRPIFQIDPRGAKVANPMDIDPELKAKLRKSPDVEVAVPLKELLDFPKLYENYPILKDFQVNFQGNLEDGGSFLARDKVITAGMSALENPKRLRELLLHELQHGIQAVEGTPGGSSASFILFYDPTTGEFKTKLKDPEWEAEIERLNLIGRKATNKRYDTPEWKNYEKAYQNLSDEAFKKYLTNSGEIEARAAELWDELSSGEKVTTRPSNVYREALGLYPKESVGNHIMPTARLQNYAEGGMVEDNQMQKLFEEGGMTDDGMTREPVTGNEIPPGSLAEEVRDDIPARLSSGEYVVPADVVRFFGVKFFEDLRMKAKEGLSEMDKDGRIGGEPEVEDEELTEEEEDMLREALGAPMEMAEGGVVPSFDRTQFKVGDTTGFQTRKYINPKTKEERNIAFINGMPLGAIPEGFVPFTEEAAKVEEVKPSEGAPEVSKEQDAGEGRDMADANKDDGQSGYAGWAEQNKDAIMADPLGFGMNALAGLEGRTGKGLGATLGGAIGGLPGAVLGSVADLSKVGNAVSDARVALSQLDPTSQAYKDLESKLNSTISGLSNVQKTAINTGLVATGKAKMNALNEVLSGGNFEYDYAKDISAPTRAVTSGFAPPPSRPGSFSSAPPSRPSTPSATPSAAPPGGAPSAGPSAGPSRGGDDRSAGGFGVDARAKGGLMMKPKKGKAKTKGLAGKQ